MGKALDKINEKSAAGEHITPDETAMAIGDDLEAEGDTEEAAKWHQAIGD
jgi:hypothetical protein